MPPVREARQETTTSTGSQKAMASRPAGSDTLGKKRTSAPGKSRCTSSVVWKDGAKFRVQELDVSGATLQHAAGGGAGEGRRHPPACPPHLLATDAAALAGQRHNVVTTFDQLLDHKSTNVAWEL